MSDLRLSSTPAIPVPVARPNPAAAGATAPVAGKPAPESPALAADAAVVTEVANGAASAALSFVDGADPQTAAIEKLKTMKPAELAKLGKTDKKAFFQALLPAALESERKYGVPAEVTLAQAAVESGWAKSPIGGYNIFGIKGSGPAGTVSLATKEGSGTPSRARFAKYNNFYEAVGEHGQLYNNGYYKKGMSQYAKDKNVSKFIDNIARIYATAPNYATKLKGVIKSYGLATMANAMRASGRTVAQ
jgi:flagellum-specific peptidoglycan hydrolase FlgJ